jgi:methylglyoxal synthase
VGAEHATPAAHTPPEATATTAENVVRASVEEVNKATLGPTGGDAEDVAHAAELEAALLVVSSPTHEAHTEDAGAAETGLPSATTTEAEV